VNKNLKSMTTACSIHSVVLLCVLVQPTSAAADEPQRFGFGRDASGAEIAAWDKDVRPDGQGLPSGAGSAEQGAPIYAAKCAICHGKTGVEGPNDRLVVNSPREKFPDAGQADSWQHRTIGNYWPYASTLFDYVQRSMPQNQPGSLTADEVYALTAYLLYLNHIVGRDVVMDKRSLPSVRMPAAGRFVTDDRLDYKEVH
jgi:cytochrome c